MADYTIKHLDEFDYYKGEKAREGMRFVYAGKGLGVTAWGMNVIKMEPNCTSYPEHNHEDSGQEEVYVILKGKVKFIADDEESELEPGMIVRVGPSQNRRFMTDATEGATILAIGATPGKPYEGEK